VAGQGVALSISLVRCWKSDESMVTFFHPRQTFAGDLDEEDSSRVSWRTDAHRAMWNARIGVVACSSRLQARGGVPILPNETAPG
jgi:hypothetical protein